ncbi:hypothetical protein [Brevibacillus reuszeri]|uniref:hypothetical protein n=1 Tax=Brevibacillus reuszeri TaxID=54915 RepID=UPI000CCC6939|nr:hypothetical protein [Brevibacillus reuszeri]
MIKKAVGKNTKALRKFRVIEMKEITQNHVGYETMPEFLSVEQGSGKKNGILKLHHNVATKGICLFEGNKRSP